MTARTDRSPALRALQPGARCALISPSGPPDVNRVRRAEALLREWDLVPVLGRHALDHHDRAHDYLAGSDVDRAADLTWAWTDPEIDAVFCTRGGYGAIRLLDLLDVDTLAAARSKPLYGSSDITALHEFWQQRLGVPTWFTPMIATGDLQDCPVNVAGLRSAVRDDGAWTIASDDETTTLLPGVAHGEVTGGNLDLLTASVGSHPSVRGRAAGRIVVLEEIDEDLYRVDGHMQVLLRSGYFDDVVGVGLGTWFRCGSPERIPELMAEALAPLNIPVVAGLRIGHGPRVSSFPMGAGATATLHADDQPRIEFDTP